MGYGYNNTIYLLFVSDLYLMHDFLQTRNLPNILSHTHQNQQSLLV